MKSIKILSLIVLLLGLTQVVQAQNSDVPGEVITALNKGDAGKLSSYLNTNVELVIGNQNDVYSKQQANEIISGFFRKNSVQSFQILHKGSKEAASFVIGTLRTSTGNYRVYVLTRKSGGTSVIQQLRIETSNE